jgi:hypothetical protein
MVAIKRTPRILFTWTYFLFVWFLPDVLAVGKHPRGSSDDSPLIDQLLEQIGLGKGSCKKVTELARAALKPATQALREVAEISTANAERDLHVWAAHQAWRQLLPTPYEFPLVLDRVANFKTDPDTKCHACLLPHGVFGSLHKAAPDLFEYLFTGGAAHLREWWTEARDADPVWYASNPIIHSEPDDTRRVPLGIHGDDAGMHHESVLAITWGSIAGAQTSTLDTRIAFTMVKTHNILNDVTMNQIYKVLAWSFKSLASGRYPYVDHEDT